MSPVLLVAVIAAAVAQGPPPVARPSQSRGRVPQISGPQQTTILANETVDVARLRMAPGSAESIRTGTTPMLVIQLTAGDVDLTQGGEKSRALGRAGSATFVPVDVPHKAVNIGEMPLDLLLIRIKPKRPAAPAAPPSDAPPGITRTTLIDNADVRLVRVQFAPGSREPVHTHPNDLLTVQISAGKVEILIGSERTNGNRDIGFVQFLPRDVPHAFVSVDTKPFELLSVSVK